MNGNDRLVDAAEKQQYVQSNITKDYELIRHEMNELKGCMTTYIGFVLGGSAATIYGLIYKGMSEGLFIEVAYISQIVPVILSLILLILFYKFHSHNRYAGYCKVLNSELVFKHQKTVWITWELCIDNVRRFDFKIENLDNLVRGIQVKIDNEPDMKSQEYIKSRIKELCFPQKKNDETCDKPKKQSWRFPRLVTYIFFVLALIFLLIEIYSIMNIKYAELSLSKIIILGCSFTAVSSMQIFLWSRFYRKLQSLLTGQDTIEAYFWRFLPFRASFLNKLGVIPKYLSC